MRLRRSRANPSPGLGVRSAKARIVRLARSHDMFNVGPGGGCEARSRVGAVHRSQRTHDVTLDRLGIGVVPLLVVGSTAVHGTLSTVRGLMPERLAGCEPTLRAFRRHLNTESVLVSCAPSPAHICARSPRHSDSVPGPRRGSSAEHPPTQNGERPTPRSSVASPVTRDGALCASRQGLAARSGGAYLGEYRG